MIQTVGLKLVQTGLQKILTDILQANTGTAYNGMLGSLYLGLFTAYSGFSLGLTGAGVTEPTYTGYARVKATWSAQGIDPTGRAEVFSQATLWVPTATGTSSTIIGMAIWSAVTAGNLYGVGLVPTPFTLSLTTDQASLTARFQMPLDPADWGQSALTD